MYFEQFYLGCLAHASYMLASEGEYLHALRDARQKLSILATREITQALPPKP